MKKWILVTVLFLGACSPTIHQYEVILLDGTQFTTTKDQYCEWYSDTNIIVRCKSLESIPWEDVYVAKEIHRIDGE